MSSAGLLIVDFWGDWLFVAVLAMGLATILVALVYALSSFLQNDKMKTWAKMELVEVIYSAIIISMALFGLPIIDALVQGALIGQGGAPTAWVHLEKPASSSGFLTSSKEWKLLNICGDIIAAPPTSVYHDVPSCHMRLGMWYLRELFDEAKMFAFDIYLDYIWTSMVAEFTINIEFLFEKAGFFTFTPWRGFYTMGNTIKALVFDWTIKIMMLTKFQEVLLRFISTAVFPSFFVIGVILRTFNFTRRLGGLLLAMALSLYFIFPAFYAFGALVMIDIKTDLQVYNDWVNHPANKKGVSNPNPPIANTMYSKGSFAMVGGEGTFSTDAAKTNLSKFENATPEQFWEWMEKKKEGAVIHFDMTDKTEHTEDEKNKTQHKVWEEGQEFFNSISKESKIDTFVERAWEPNGPIETLARITFWSLFFSLFSLIATIAGIRSLSITFGGDIEIAGLTRLI